MVRVAIKGACQNAGLTYSDDGVSTLPTHGVDWFMAFSLCLRIGTRYTTLGVLLPFEHGTNPRRCSADPGQCLKTLPH